MPRQDLPQIDGRLCTLCGDCIYVCPTNCLTLRKGIEVVVAPQDCISCGVCEAVCPAGAIAMTSRDW